MRSLSPTRGSSLTEALLALLVLALASLSLVRVLPRGLQDNQTPLQQLRASEVAAGLLEEATLPSSAAAGSPTLATLPTLSADARLQSTPRVTGPVGEAELTLTWRDAMGRPRQQRWSQVAPPQPTRQP